MAAQLRTARISIDIRMRTGQGRIEDYAEGWFTEKRLQGGRKKLRS